MSSALAIAAVSASLKDLLNNGLIDHDLSSIGSFSVTAQPPDRITTGQTEANQLNLFLYQVTPNLGWRNAGLPSRDSRGARITNPPLALDLHYLLTAYGAADLNAEVLLGYAMQLLHDNPVLTRQQLRTVLAAPSPVDGTVLPGLFGALSALDLADQIELLKITPVYLGTEDLSKLWTAMQARYRPSMAYLVSVVLIQRAGATRSALPVLRRGPDDRGPIVQGAPAPVLASIRPAASEMLPAVRLGEDLVVRGTNLRAGAATLQLESVRLGIQRALPITTPPGPAAGQLVVHVPGVAEDAGAMSEWAVGVYTAALRIAAPDQPAWVTNGVPVALAPLITVKPLSAPAGTVSLTVTCTPRLRPEQEARAWLLLGDTAFPATAITTPANPSEPTTLQFTLPGVAAGAYLVRLRVDGIDSLPVTLTGSPPRLEFDPQQTVTVS
jgi:Pvc16 N-terminal domain